MCKGNCTCEQGKVEPGLDPQGAISALERLLGFAEASGAHEPVEARRQLLAFFAELPCVVPDPQEVHQPLDWLPRATPEAHLVPDGVEARPWHRRPLRENEAPASWNNRKLRCYGTNCIANLQAIALALAEPETMARSSFLGAELGRHLIR